MTLRKGQHLFNEISKQKELIKNGLGDFVPSVKDDCKHELIFKESLPRNSKWFCRYCFTEIDITQYRERDAK